VKVYKTNSKKMREIITANCDNSANAMMEEKCLMIAPVLVTIDGITNKLFDKKLCKRTLCSKAFLISSNIISRKKSDACNMCKYALDLLLKRFEFSRQAIQRYFAGAEGFCSNGKFNELSAECKLFVNRTEALLEDIIKNAKSAEVCNRMELCRKKSESSFSNFWKLVSGDLSTCGICKSVIETSRRRANTKGITEPLSRACKGLKQFSGNQVCQTILGQKGEIEDKSMKGKSAEEVCQRLQLCGGSRKIGDVIGGILKGFKNMFG